MKKRVWGVAAGLIAGGAAAWAVWDYKRWMDLGPGGLPATVRGWVTMTRFRFLAKDGLDVRPFAAQAAEPGGFRALGNVEPRRGERPAVSPYPVPHRQLGQLPDEATRATLRQLFKATVERHSGTTEWALSHFEKRHPAITLKDWQGTASAASHGEIAHIHPSDSSMHMIFSAADAIAAMDAGWGQLHGLAGIAVGLPATYVMVYAPRDENDLRATAQLLDAAIAYAAQPAA